MPVEVVTAPQISQVNPVAERRFILEPNQPECRVLVVDDDSAGALVLEQILARAGFAVRVVGSGAAAIEAFQQWDPRFIWMDNRMPEMSGTEAARRIRELPGGRDVKIAVVTASVFESERETVLAAGADDFVRKPYRPDEIFAMMTRHLDVRSGNGSTAPESPGSMRLLARIAPELRDELRCAVIALDGSRIRAAIKRVEEHDHELGAALTRYADRLSYTEILRALDRGDAAPAASSAAGIS